MSKASSRLGTRTSLTSPEHGDFQPARRMLRKETDSTEVLATQPVLPPTEPNKDKKVGRRRILGRTITEERPKEKELLLAEATEPGATESKEPVMDIERLRTETELIRIEVEALRQRYNTARSYVQYRSWSLETVGVLDRTQEKMVLPKRFGLTDTAGRIQFYVNLICGRFIGYTREGKREERRRDEGSLFSLRSAIETYRGEEDIGGLHELLNQTRARVDILRTYIENFEQAVEKELAERKLERERREALENEKRDKSLYHRAQKNSIQLSEELWKAEQIRRRLFYGRGVAIKIDGFTERIQKIIEQIETRILLADTLARSVQKAYEKCNYNLNFHYLPDRLSTAIHQVHDPQKLFPSENRKTFWIDDFIPGTEKIRLIKEQTARNIENFYHHLQALRDLFNQMEQNGIFINFTPQGENHDHLEGRTVRVAHEWLDFIRNIDLNSARQLLENYYMTGTNPSLDDLYGQIDQFTANVGELQAYLSYVESAAQKTQVFLQTTDEEIKELEKELEKYPGSERCPTPRSWGPKAPQPNHDILKRREARPPLARGLDARSYRNWHASRDIAEGLREKEADIEDEQHGKEEARFQINLERAMSDIPLTKEEENGLRKSFETPPPPQPSQGSVSREGIRDWAVRSIGNISHGIRGRKKGLAIRRRPSKAIESEEN